MDNVISEYMGNSRKAVIRKEREGFEVDLLLNDAVIETRKVHNHSETYAENVAENYVLGVFDIKEQNGYSGYYGYREKSDNFHPDLD